MNASKVKALVEQAHEVVFHAPSSGRTTTQLNTEKLIELAALECLRLIEGQKCHPDVVRNEWFRGHDQAVRDCATAIRMTFNIEDHENR